RAEIADLRHRQEQAHARVEQLRDAKARWQDDAYAEQQIRRRLHYVMPGETGYVVIDPGAAQQSRTDRGAAHRPWYANVWDGVDKSDASDQ
ncbi:FtsB family cell division protein, partial [Streptomyces seoulensis]